VIWANRGQPDLQFLYTNRAVGSISGFSPLANLFAEYKDLQVTEQRWFDGQWVPR